VGFLINERQSSITIAPARLSKCHKVWQNGGLGVKKLKTLEKRNAKLKKLLTESILMLDAAKFKRDARKISNVQDPFAVS
jgi:hypothetical protein